MEKLLVCVCLDMRRFALCKLLLLSFDGLGIFLFLLQSSVCTPTSDVLFVVLVPCTDLSGLGSIKMGLLLILLGKMSRIVLDLVRLQRDYKYVRKFSIQFQLCDKD